MTVNIPIELIWGLCGYIVVTTGAFIWWAATTSEQLKNLKEVVVNLANNNILYARKEDVAREMGVIELRQEKMWEKLDILKEKINAIK